MIDYENKRINDCNKKRIYLIDKINAYFYNAKKKENPVTSFVERMINFDNKIDRCLEVFNSKMDKEKCEECGNIHKKTKYRLVDFPEHTYYYCHECDVTTGYEKKRAVGEINKTNI